MMAYQCDRCGKIYDWYETVYEDPEFNCNISFKEHEKYRKEHGYNPIGFSANCMKFMFLEPANENCSTNKGSISADIEECQEGNNDLIMLCRECMHEFMGSLQDFWNRI